MKKLSYILLSLGVILIIISVLFININNNDKNNDNNKILWSVEYQKGEIKNNNLKEYNESLNRKVIINHDNNFYYIIPKDIYLSRIGDGIIEYQNNDIIILRYNFFVNDDKIQRIINSYDDSLKSILTLKHILPNGNILLLEKKYDDHYSEILHLFIKIDEVSFYHIEYRIDNMVFSDAIINEIINTEKYKDGNINYINKDGEWDLSLDVKNKKNFTLKYNQSKYFNNSDYHDYELYLKVDKDIDKTVDVLFNYNFLVMEREIYTSYTITSNKQIKIKDYDCILYTTVDNFNEEYINYAIMIDNNTKLLITFNKVLEDKVDVNDFLNFTYE